MIGLPLLRLPLLPLKDVFDEICLSDLISFHLCSKKTRELLKVLNKSVSFDSLSLDQKEKLDALEKIRLLSLEIVNNPVGSLACFPKESVIIQVVISGRLTIKLEKNNSYANAYKDCFPLSINVLANINKFVDTKSYFEVDDNIIPVVTDENELFTFWDDQSHGLHSLVNHFKKLFNSQTVECFIFDSTTSKFSQNLEIAAKGMARHTLAKCIVTGYIFNDYHNNLILNSFNPTTPFGQVNRSTNFGQTNAVNFLMNGYGYNTHFGKFNQFGLPMTNYYGYNTNIRQVNAVNFLLNGYGYNANVGQIEHSNFLENDYYGCYAKFKLEYFVLNPANWFKLDRLSSMDCAEIELLKSSFTYDDMCECMIRWMDGQYPKLKRLIVQLVESFNLRVLFLSYKSLQERSGDQYLPQRYTVVLKLAAIQIKLDNKTVATISTKYSRPENLLKMNIL